MKDPKRDAQILRLHHAEKWPPGTIATQLGLHISVVKRVLAEDGSIPSRAIRSSQIDPFIPFIQKILEQYPRLTAARLYQMVKERGYAGRPDYFRTLVSRYRPPRSPEAFLRLKATPGDQAQVDWGHFGKIAYGSAKRPLSAFVMVLSHSRDIFLRFFPSQQLTFFLQGHREAFERWNGVPRSILYDNLKSCVLERVGDAIRFHPELYALAGHYCYEPRPVAPYRPNEKPRVERAIRFVRTSFFAARPFRDLDHLNAQADQWCRTVSRERRWPDDTTLGIEDVLERDLAALRPLPLNPFPCEERKEVRIGKTPYARFDLNDYSVPHTLTRKTLTVYADLHVVRILDQDTVVAEHPRSFGRRQLIEDPAHIDALVQEKRAARKGRLSEELTRLAPASEKLLAQLAQRHQPLGRTLSELKTLLSTYGAKALDRAIEEALDKQAVHPQAVRHILEREQERRGEAAALPIPLPNDPRLDGLGFRTHSLDAYDDLDEEEEDVA